MLRAFLCWLAIAALLTAARAENIPDVSRADQTAIKRAYGEKVAAMIFSHGLAKLRAEKLKESGALPWIPGSRAFARAPE